MPMLLHVAVLCMTAWCIDASRLGPLAEMPYFKKITLAHQLHHSEKFGGVPFGLFLAAQV